MTFPHFIQLPPSLAGVLVATGSVQGNGVGGNLPAFNIHVSVSGNFAFQEQPSRTVVIQSDLIVAMNVHDNTVDGSTSPVVIDEPPVVVPILGSNNSASSNTTITLELGAPVVWRLLSIPQRSVFHG